MENALLEDIFESMQENIFYVKIPYKIKTDELVYKEICIIQKNLPKETHEALANCVYSVQSQSEKYGFIFGMKYAIRLLYEFNLIV